MCAVWGRTPEQPVQLTIPARPKEPLTRRLGAIPLHLCRRFGYSALINLVEAATLVSQQYELLMGDSLIVAVMQAHGLTNLASNDADFDRVSDLTRYAPI
jgi:hypothetical protein